MFWPFKSKSVEKHLNAVRKIKLHHMNFKIKKINVIDHCTGAQVCSAVYDIYQSGNAKNNLAVTPEKIKSHYVDVLMAGIVYPSFSRKPDEQGKIFIENLLTDWGLATELYSEIIAYSYGKKNSTQLTSQGKS
jgi:hypothetical protein